MNPYDVGDTALDDLVETILRKSAAFKLGFKEGFRTGAALVAAIFLVTVVIAMTGCGFTQQGTFVRQAVKIEGAKAYDESIANSAWFLCQAASVGSLRRWLGTDATRAAAWATLCYDPNVNLFQVEHPDVNERL